jgi:hypothetical protein
MPFGSMPLARRQVVRRWAPSRLPSDTDIASSHAVGRRCAAAAAVRSQHAMRALARSPHRLSLARCARHAASASHLFAAAPLSPPFPPPSDRALLALPAPLPRRRLSHPHTVLPAYYECQTVLRGGAPTHSHRPRRCATAVSPHCADAHTAHAALHPAPPTLTLPVPPITATAPRPPRPAAPTLTPPVPLLRRRHTALHTAPTLTLRRRCTGATTLRRRPAVLTLAPPAPPGTATALRRCVNAHAQAGERAGPVDPGHPVLGRARGLHAGGGQPAGAAGARAVVSGTHQT